VRSISLTEGIGIREKGLTDGDLDEVSRFGTVKSLLVVLQVKDVGDHTLDVDSATVQVGNGSREAEDLREGTEDGDLVTEDLHGRPVNTGVVVVDSVDQQGSASSDPVDGIVDHRLDTSALANNVETVCRSGLGTKGM
jgi:hypothetical protein